MSHHMFKKTRYVEPIPFFFQIELLEETATRVVGF